MAKFRGAIVVDIERCKGCGVCITACPCGVIELAKEVNGKVTITPSWRTPKPASAALAAASHAPTASSRFTRKPCNQNLLSNKSKNLT